MYSEVAKWDYNATWPLKKSPRPTPPVLLFFFLPFFRYPASHFELTTAFTADVPFMFYGPALVVLHWAIAARIPEKQQQNSPVFFCLEAASFRLSGDKALARARCREIPP